MKKEFCPVCADGSFTSVCGYCLKNLEKCKPNRKKEQKPKIYNKNKIENKLFVGKKLKEILQGLD